MYTSARLIADSGGDGDSDSGYDKSKCPSSKSFVYRTFELTTAILLLSVGLTNAYSSKGEWTFMNSVTLAVIRKSEVDSRHAGFYFTQRIFNIYSFTFGC